MKSMKVFTHFSVILNLICYLPVLAASPTPAKTKIKVTLLGQKCDLEGPRSQGTLTSIHSIGPDQIYPAVSLSSSQFAGEKTKIQKAMEKAKGAKDLPPELEKYRSLLIRRFEQQIAFLDGLIHLKKSQSTEFLLKAGKENLAEIQFGTYKSLVRKLELSQKSPNQERELTEETFNLYNEGIVDPETEFHKAIKRINVQYNCSFE
jgi:hypothetical protein